MSRHHGRGVNERELETPQKNLRRQTEKAYVHRTQYEIAELKRSKMCCIDANHYNSSK